MKTTDENDKNIEYEENGKIYVFSQIKYKLGEIIEKSL